MTSEWEVAIIILAVSITTQLLDCMNCGLPRVGTSTTPVHSSAHVYSGVHIMT